MKKVSYIYLNARDDLYRLDIAKIVYFEAAGNYTNFVMSNKLRGTVLMSLSQMQDMLTSRLREQASIFARVGKRFIINLGFVYHIDIAKQQLTLSDGERFAYGLPISRDALRKLKELFVGVDPNKA